MSTRPAVTPVAIALGLEGPPCASLVDGPPEVEAELPLPLDPPNGLSRDPPNPLLPLLLPDPPNGSVKLPPDPPNGLVSPDDPELPDDPEPVDPEPVDPEPVDPEPVDPDAGLAGAPLAARLPEGPEAHATWPIVTPIAPAPRRAAAAIVATVRRRRPPPLTGGTAGTG